MDLPISHSKPIRQTGLKWRKRETDSAGVFDLRKERVRVESIF